MLCTVRLGLLLCISASWVTLAQEANSKTIRLDFVGNKAFGKQQLLDVADKCLNQYSSLRGTDELSKIDYCLHKVRSFLAANGYLRATLVDPLQKKTEGGLILIVQIEEGALYHLGEVRINGATVFSPTRIREMLSLKAGDIANADSISEWAYECLKKAYGEFGYIQYTAELEPSFHLKHGATEGTVDLTVTIDEGQAFSIRSIKFNGNADVPQDSLLRQMLLRSGDIFNRELFQESMKRIDQSGQFELIDEEKDVDYRSDQKGPQLDLIIHLKRKLGN